MIHILIQINHLKFNEFDDDQHKVLRDNIQLIFKQCFKENKLIEITLQETYEYIRSYDTISYRPAFQISYVNFNNK